jgi:hypothetical protein
MTAPVTECSEEEQPSVIPRLSLNAVKTSNKRYGPEGSFQICGKIQRRTYQFMIGILGIISIHFNPLFIYVLTGLPKRPIIMYA